MSATYAHSRNANGERDLLADHLRRTADRAAEFATPFAMEAAARTAGVLHDVGKASPEFQAYLRRCEAGEAGGGGPDHKGAGAAVAKQLGLEYLTLLIHGHHGGLRDWGAARLWLRERLEADDVRTTLGGLPDDVRALLPTQSGVPLPACLKDDFELLLRMTFSALVDADFLDTEAHFRPEMSLSRRGEAPGLGELRDRLVADQGRLEAAHHAGEVNAVRRTVARAAREAAEMAPGLFRLAVPTGGGKTRAAMAFGLDHALRHGQRRVIVAVPFTSITEQTADVYRTIFGPDTVLEHHSGVDLESKDPRRRLWARLASENWDAPIVVTTTVQLLESLFANGTSKTRKLHRIARSVIVIDEAQALPVRLIGPIARMLRHLCERCGSSVVLSTATQPAGDVAELAWLMSEARDIVPAAERLFERMRRVEWVWAGDAWAEDRIASEMASSPQAMVVVNTRGDAIRQLDRLPGALHLSTLLCGAHRRRVLDGVRRRLADGEPCHLVSTQVVEAGVDVDFPLVLRALAPFDGIVQAGGRCNREGRRAVGRVVVFEPARGRLPADYVTGTAITRSMLAAGPLDFDDPLAAAAYFRELYRNKDLDAGRVAEARARFAYEAVAKRFRMIEDGTEPVLVPYDASAQAVIAELAARSTRSEDAGRARALMRHAQPYLVGLRPREMARARREGWIGDGVVPVWVGPYDPVRGLGAVMQEDEGGMG